MHLRAYISGRIRAALAGAVLACAGQLMAQTVDTVVSTNLFEPYGVAVDDLNNYYITDSAHNRIAKFNPNTGVLVNLAGALGAEGSFLDEQGEAARFSNPEGIATIADGLIVADSGNHVIRKVTFGGKVTTLAGTPGTPGAFVASASASSAQFNSPSGLASDGRNIVYIADTLNNAIRKLDITNKVVTTISTLGWFFRPTAVAVDDQGWIYVADTGNHSIKRFKEGVPVQLVAGSGSRFLSGMVNSPVGANALFNSPRGLYWAGTNTQLLVSDSGNHILRRITNLRSDPLVAAVETFGNTDSAGLATPIGIAKDTSASVLFADLDKNAVRIIRVSQVNQPPVTAPSIGTVILTNFCGTILTAVTNATFNNEVVVAMRTEPGTETFYTFGQTENFDSIPDPTRSDLQPPVYSDCMDALPTNLLDLITPRPPRITIKAYSTQSDRRPSSVIVAQFTFQVGNPILIGNNPNSLRIETVTKDAEIWYNTGETEAATLDPTNRAPSFRYLPGSPLVIRSTGNVAIKARAFKPTYVPSAMVKRTFLTNDVAVNNVGTIGIARDFVGGMGSTVVVPIDVNVNPNNAVQSLQFRVEVCPLKGDHSAPLRSLAFSTNDFIPVKLGGSGGSGNFLVNALPYTVGLTNGLGFGFVGTNSAFQLENANTVALLGVQIPASCGPGDTFQINVMDVSATTDGVQTPATLTSLEPRIITVKNERYLVGDTAVGTGYNNTEFGDGELKNNDVNNAFFASLGFRIPLRVSELFDAMDVFPEDTESLVGGDGLIRFMDWQILLQRSLHLNTNYSWRSWTTNGVRVPLFPGSSGPAIAAAPLARQAVTVSNQVVWNRPVLLGALTLEGIPQTAPAEIPIYVKVDPGLALSGMQFVAYVVPEGDTPAINQNVTFVPAEGIPAPSISGNSVPGAGNLPNAVYCAWNIGAFGNGLSGSNLLGKVHFNIPGLAITGTRYTLYFGNADGSSAQKANGGYDQYDFETIRGSAWVNSAAKVAPERLPDEWKQNFFGSLTDPAAAASADPDGDGAANLTEYLDGTDPEFNNLRFVLRDGDWRRELAQGKFVLSWFGSSGQSYSVQASTDLARTNWSTLLSGAKGAGALLNYTNPSTASNPQFFRLQVTPQKQP